MKNKYIFEILLTTNHVTEDSWLSFFNMIGKLNGFLKHFDIYATTYLNEVRFFLVTNQLIPPILNSLGDFLIKRLEECPELDFKYYLSLFPFYLVTNKEKNLLDISDKMEARKGERLAISKMRFYYLGKDRFFLKTSLFFQSGKLAPLRKKKAFFAIPHYFFSIDFSIYNRFFYRKNANEYLDIQKTLPALKSEKSHALLKIDTFPYLSDTYYLNPFSYEFQKHSMIIGSSGTGKSKFAASYIKEICQTQNPTLQSKVIVIDPHASLETDIGGLDNSCILDFKTPDHSANLFMQNNGHDMIASVELMLSLFKTLMQDQYNSRLERVLRHSIHLLEANNNLNFSNLRKLLLDIDYRNSLISKEETSLPDSIINFFFTDFNELKSKSYQEAISPIIAFLDEMELLPVFQEKYDLLEIKNIIEDHNLTIFSLDQASLGEKVTKTISGLVMQQVWELVKSHTYSQPIILVIDEVSVVENPILARLLSEARKYNLSVVLIQQYFGQISEELRKSIFANVLNFYVFRVSKADALLLENNLQINVAVHNSYKIRLKILTELKNRECIARICQNGVLLPAFKAKTLDFTPIPRKNQIQILRITPLYKKKNSSQDVIFKEDSTFSIDDTTESLKDILLSQSSGRKQVIRNG